MSSLEILDKINRYANLLLNEEVYKVRFFLIEIICSLVELYLKTFNDEANDLISD